MKKGKSTSGLNCSDISLEKKGKLGGSTDSRSEISLEKKSLATGSQTVNKPVGFES